MFNWAILGAGRIAHKFAKDIASIEGARIYAVASKSMERASTFAEAYDAPHALDSYEALCDLEGVDAVYIATRHIYHAENAIMCLKAGLPVLCEKPFAMNTQQVSQMISAARTHDTYLMEAFWTRFLPHMKKVLALIESGAIGEVKSLKADFGFKANYDPEGRLFNKALGGGSLLDIGVYPLFLSLLLFGKPDSIKASALFGETGVDEVCAMLLKFPSNKLAILDSTILSDTKSEAMIYGTNGHIHMHGQWHRVSTVTLHRDGVEEAEVFEFESNTFGYNYEAMAVMKDLANLSAGQAGAKKESELMPLDFSLLIMETLDAIRVETGIIYNSDKVS